MIFSACHRYESRVHRRARVVAAAGTVFESAALAWDTAWRGATRGGGGRGTGGILPSPPSSTLRVAGRCCSFWGAVVGGPLERRAGQHPAHCVLYPLRVLQAALAGGAQQAPVVRAPPWRKGGGVVGGMSGPRETGWHKTMGARCGRARPCANWHCHGLASCAPTGPPIDRNVGDAGGYSISFTAGCTGRAVAPLDCRRRAWTPFFGGKGAWERGPPPPTRL